MGGNSLVLGKTIICMDMVCILGKMVEDMRDTMKWIRSMGMEFTNGLMVEDMKEIGVMASNMEKEDIF
jgi:hypothetical protein